VEKGGVFVTCSCSGLVSMDDFYQLVRAAAWCATFEPSAVEELNWRVSWHQYANQRKGRLPKWVEELAQRMLFEWPT